MITITNSTAFNTATYNQDNNELIVEYKTGRKYTYSGVTLQEVDNIISAPSKGSMLKHVIAGKVFVHNE